MSKYFQKGRLLTMLVFLLVAGFGLIAEEPSPANAAGQELPEKESAAPVPSRSSAPTSELRARENYLWALTVTGRPRIDLLLSALEEEPDYSRARFALYDACSSDEDERYATPRLAVLAKANPAEFPLTIQAFQFCELGGEEKLEDALVWVETVLNDETQKEISHAAPMKKNLQGALRKLYLHLLQRNETESLRNRWVWNAIQEPDCAGFGPVLALETGKMLWASSFRIPEKARALTEFQELQPRIDALAAEARGEELEAFLDYYETVGNTEQYRLVAERREQSFPAKSAELRTWLGDSFQRRGCFFNIGDSQARTDRWEKLAPEFRELQNYFRSKLAMAQGDFFRAKSLRDKVKNPEMRNYLSLEIACRTGDLSAAMATLREQEKLSEVVPFARAMSKAQVIQTFRNRPLYNELVEQARRNQQWSEEEMAELNNTIGYISLSVGIDPAEAEELVRMSLEESVNAARLDSLAWALYYQKKYDQAAEVIADAIAALEPEEILEHGLVFEHAGDIAAARSRRDDAKAFYQSALRCREANDFRPAAVEKKLAELK